MATTLDWLRQRSSAALVELLVTRPDLAVPAPTDLSVLARRLDTPPSVWRAMETCNRFEIQLLQAVTALGRKGHHVTRAEVAELLGPGVAPDAIDRGLEGLETIGLVRGPDGVRAAAAVTTSLGEFPAGLGPPGTLTGRPLRTALDRASQDGRALLERLSQGQPRGLVTPDSGTATVVEELVAAGLLIRSDPHTVLLPLQVCLALRGDHPLGPVHPELPATKPTKPGVTRVDGTAGGQALASVALARRLLDVLGTSPAQALKSGGVGVRELRRVARHADAPEPVVALHLELLSAAELISPSDVRARYPVSHWTPTEAADAFQDESEENAWATLARQWLELRTDPARVGSRDQGDKVVNALSFELAWARGPADRRFVLAELTELPPGSGLTLTDLRERLAWRGPLRVAERVGALSETVMSEATALGLVAFDTLSTAGRMLLDDPDEAAAALVASLPDPVEEFLVQADLTVIAPGRLSRDLARLLGQVADIESSGSATVYRVTPDSLRRGFDDELAAAEIHELFRSRSRTPVPQALTYLIDDVARRHGVLRIGSASAYLRSDDITLIDAAVAAGKAAGLSVRRLAPTVAVSPAKVEDLLDRLRDAGLVPAAEDARGGVITLTPRSHRIKARSDRVPQWREPPAPTPDQVAALVDRMRAADSAAVPDADLTPMRATALLRDAVTARSSVWIGYVDSQGSRSRRLVEPIAVSGGTMAAFDHLRQSVRTFALHRITEVAPVE